MHTHIAAIYVSTSKASSTHPNFKYKNHIPSLINIELDDKELSK